MSMADNETYVPRSFVGRTWARLWSLLIGSILALSGPTSLLLLGWLMRQTRDAAFKRAGLERAHIGWVLGAPGRGFFHRLLGGLAASIREGVLAAISLMLATLPFTAAWILSWWAGWENSFSKGYEQALVGPALGISGILIFAILMIYLPMALAHQAVEGRAFALFEYRQVKSAVRHSGWRYIGLALLTVVLAIPLFGSRILIIFSEGIYPGIVDFTPDQLATLSQAILFAKAVYVVVTLTILRRWVGRIYADAAIRARVGRDATLWTNSALARATTEISYRGYFIGRVLRFILLFGIWIAFAIQLYFTQFMKHSWMAWITQPYTFLPWVF